METAVRSEIHHMGKFQADSCPRGRCMKNHLFLYIDSSTNVGTTRNICLSGRCELNPLPAFQFCIMRFEMLLQRAVNSHLVKFFISAVEWNPKGVLE